MDKYHIGDEIGRGKNSIVYKGRMRKKIKYIAIKSVTKNKMDKILHEVRIMYKLNHPNCLKFYSWYETSNHIWLILEYCTGGSLYELLSQDQQLPESAVRMFGADLVSALHYLHSLGILYCDLKPTNILFNECGVLKLSDFALAKRISNENGEPIEDVGGARRGTPCYMAPELFATGGVHSYASEHWALGCLLYELSMGSPPFVSNSFKTLVTLIQSSPLQLPESSEWTSNPLKNLLRSLLRKDPARRIKWPEILMHEFWGDLPMPDTSTVMSPIPAYSRYLHERVYVPSCPEEDEIDEYFRPSSIWQHDLNPSYSEETSQSEQQDLGDDPTSEEIEGRGRTTTETTAATTSRDTTSQSNLSLASGTTQKLGDAGNSIGNGLQVATNIPHILPPKEPPPALPSPRAGHRLSQQGSVIAPLHKQADENLMQVSISGPETGTNRSLVVREDTLRLSRIVQNNLQHSASQEYNPNGTRLSGSRTTMDPSKESFLHEPDPSLEQDVIIPSPDTELDFEDDPSRLSPASHTIQSLDQRSFGDHSQSESFSDEQRVANAQQRTQVSPRARLYSDRARNPESIHPHPPAAYQSESQQGAIDDRNGTQHTQAHLATSTTVPPPPPPTAPPPPPPPDALRISTRLVDAQTQKNSIGHVAAAFPTESSETTPHGKGLAAAQPTVTPRRGSEHKFAEEFRVALRKRENGVAQQSATESSKADLPNSDVEQSPHDHRIHAARDLETLLHCAADSAIKPIVGNPSIGKFPKAPYNPANLPFIPKRAEVVCKMSKEDLQEYFSKVYVSLNAASESATKSSDASLETTTDILGYLFTLCDTQKLANILVNSSLVVLLIRLAQGSPAMQTVSESTASLLNEVKTRVVLILAYLIRHAMYISPEVGERRLLPAMDSFSHDSNPTVQRCNAAGLGELVFYMTTNANQPLPSSDNSTTSTRSPMSSRRWKRVSSEAVVQLLRNLDATDSFTRLCAAKAFENVLSTTKTRAEDSKQSPQPGYRLATVETLSRLALTMGVAIQESNELLASSCANAVSHILRIDCRYVKNFLQLSDFDTWVLLRSGLVFDSSTVQQPSLNIVNTILLDALNVAAIAGTNTEEGVDPMFGQSTQDNGNQAVDEMQEILQAILESTQAPAIRAKCCLAVALLLRLDESGEYDLVVDEDLLLSVEKFVAKHATFTNVEGSLVATSQREPTINFTHALNELDSEYLAACIAVSMREMARYIERTAKMLREECFHVQEILSSSGIPGICARLGVSEIENAVETLNFALSSTVQRHQCASSEAVIQAMSNFMRTCDALTTETNLHLNGESEFPISVEDTKFAQSLEDEHIPLLERICIKLAEAFTTNQDSYTNADVAPLVVSELLPAVLVRCMTPKPDVRVQYFRLAVSLMFALLDYGCCFEDQQHESQEAMDEPRTLSKLGKQMTALVHESIMKHLASFLRDVVPIPQFALRLLQRLFDDIPAFSLACGKDEEAMDILLSFMKYPDSDGTSEDGMTSSGIVLWVSGLMCQLLRNPAVFRSRVENSQDDTVATCTRDVFRVTRSILRQAGLREGPTQQENESPQEQDEMVSFQLAHLEDELGWVVGLGNTLTCWAYCGQDHSFGTNVTCTRAAHRVGLVSCAGEQNLPSHGIEPLRNESSVAAVLIFCISNAQLGIKSTLEESPSPLDLDSRFLVRDWEMSCEAAEVLVHLCRVFGAATVLVQISSSEFPVSLHLAQRCCEEAGGGKISSSNLQVPTHVRWPRLFSWILHDDGVELDQHGRVFQSRLQLAVVMVLQGAVDAGLLSGDEYQEVKFGLLHLQRFAENEELLEAIGDLISLGSDTFGASE